MNTIIKNLKKLFLILLLLSNSIYANYIGTDKIILKTEDNIILKSQLKKFRAMTALCAIETVRPEKKKDYVNKIIYGLIILNNNLNLLDNATSDFEKDISIGFTHHFAPKYGTTFSNFRRGIKKLYNTGSMTLTNFYITGASVAQLKKMTAFQNISLSWGDIKNFFEFSNYYELNKTFYNYEFIQIIIYKTKGFKFRHLKKVMTIMKNERKIPNIMKRLKSKNIRVRHAIISPSKTLYTAYKDYFKEDKDNIILRPIYQDGFIFIVKMIRRVNRLDRHKPFIKVLSHKLQEKKINKKKCTVKFLNLEMEVKKENLHRLINSKKKHIWISGDNVEREIFDRIRNLKPNSISPIIQTSTGWYIFKVLERNIDQRSNVYSFAEDNTLFNKVSDISYNMLENIIENSDIAIYD